MLMMRDDEPMRKKNILKSSLLSAHFAVSNEIQKNEEDEKRTLTHEINVNVQMSTFSGYLDVGFGFYFAPLPHFILLVSLVSLFFWRRLILYIFFYRGYR